MHGKKVALHAGWWFIDPFSSRTGRIKSTPKLTVPLMRERKKRSGRIVGTDGTMPGDKTHKVSRGNDPGLRPASDTQSDNPRPSDSLGQLNFRPSWTISCPGTCRISNDEWKPSRCPFIPSSRYWQRQEKTGPCRIVGSADQSTEQSFASHF